MDVSRKLLVQMSGAPGSGKSTTSHLLAQSIDAVIINHDLLKTFFLESDMPWEKATQHTYRLQWTLAEDIIKQKRNVIMDSTCNYSNVLDQGTALAQKYGYDYIYVECRVKLDDIDVLDQRLRQRDPLRSQRTGVTRPPADARNAVHSEEEYRALFTRWIDNPCRPAGDAIVVDGTGRRSPEENLDYILKQIAATPGVQASSSERPPSQ